MQNYESYKGFTVTEWVNSKRRNVNHKMPKGAKSFPTKIVVKL